MRAICWTDGLASTHFAAMLGPMRRQLTALLTVLAASIAYAQDDVQVTDLEPIAPAEAVETREDRLDRLLARLADAPDAETADPIADDVLAFWLTSQSPTVDLLIDRAATAAAEPPRDLGLARRLLDEAVGFAPDFAEAFRRRAELALEADDPVAALEDLNRALIVEPRDFRVLTRVGVILERFGETAAAYESYKQALEIHPHFEPAQAAADRLAGELDRRL
ncbi:MAG: hypothetical protein ACFB2Z_03450 [Maricaulaceae bacterium]